MKEIMHPNGYILYVREQKDLDEAYEKIVNEIVNSYVDALKKMIAKKGNTQ